MKKIKPLIVGSTIIATLGTTVSTLASCANDISDVQKQLLPTVKQYDISSKSSFHFTISSQIYYDANVEGLTSLLQLLQQRLMDAGMTFGLIPLVDNTNITIDNCIQINVAPNLIVESSLPDAYTIEINKQINIHANGLRGVLYAFHTLMQIYKINNEKIYYGYVLDYPDIAERVIHLDCGRKYFTPTWIKNFIVEASYKKINTIQLHFSEISCMRLQLPPGNPLFNLAGARDDFDKRFITAEEMIDIVHFAQLYQIEIIPSLDTPGHARWIIEWYNQNHTGEDITLKNNGGNVEFVTAIDITSNNARQYIKDLYQEYGKFFYDLGCRKFNIGFDEFVTYNLVDSTNDTGYSTIFKQYAIDHLDVPAAKATGFDTLNEWMNEIKKLLVENVGYQQIIAFNDQFLYDLGNITPNIPIDSDIVVAYWTHSSTDKYATINQIAANGYDLYNLNDDYLYYVLSAGMQKPQPNRIFNDWNVYKFSQNIANLPTKYLSQYRGAYYCIWSDYYTRETQDVIYQGTFKSIATFAEKTWNVFSKLDYNQNLKNIINIGTDIENSNSISPFLTSKDDHIFGPNVIDTASVEYSDGNNSEYFMDDVNWNASTKNINWTILNPDPKFRDLLYIDTNATIGTTRGTCLVRYPDWSQLPEGNYVFTLQAEVTSDSGDKVLYMKQITVVY